MCICDHGIFTPAHVFIYFYTHEHMPLITNVFLYMGCQRTAPVIRRGVLEFRGQRPHSREWAIPGRNANNYNYEKGNMTTQDTFCSYSPETVLFTQVNV